MPFPGRKHARHAVDGVECSATGVGIPGQIKWAEFLLQPRCGVIAHHALQLKNFKIQRPVAIRNNVELRKAVRQGNAIQRFGEEVDRRGAKQIERGSLQPALQPCLLLFQSDDQIELVRLAIFERFSKFR